MPVVRAASSPAIKNKIRANITKNAGPSFAERVAVKLEAKQQSSRADEKAQWEVIKNAKKSGRAKSAERFRLPLSEKPRPFEEILAEKIANNTRTVRGQMREYQNWKKETYDKIAARTPLFTASQVSDWKSEIEKKSEERRKAMVGDERKMWAHLSEITAEDRFDDRPLLMDGVFVPKSYKDDWATFYADCPRDKDGKWTQIKSANGVVYPATVSERPSSAITLRPLSSWC